MKPTVYQNLIGSIKNPSQIGQPQQTYPSQGSQPGQQEQLNSPSMSQIKLVESFTNQQINQNPSPQANKQEVFNPFAQQPLQSPSQQQQYIPFNQQAQQYPNNPYQNPTNQLSPSHIPQHSNESPQNYGHKSPGTGMQGWDCNQGNQFGSNPNVPPNTGFQMNQMYSPNQGGNVNPFNENNIQKADPLLPNNQNSIHDIDAILQKILETEEWGLHHAIMNNKTGMQKPNQQDQFINVGIVQNQHILEIPIRNQDCVKCGKPQCVYSYNDICVYLRNLKSNPQYQQSQMIQCPICQASVSIHGFVVDLSMDYFLAYLKETEAENISLVKSIDIFANDQIKVNYSQDISSIVIDKLFDKEIIQKTYEYLMKNLIQQRIYLKQQLQIQDPNTIRFFEVNTQSLYDLFSQEILDLIQVAQNMYPSQFLYTKSGVQQFFPKPALFFSMVVSVIQVFS